MSRAVLTAAEAARRAGVPVSLVLTAVFVGKLPAVRLEPSGGELADEYRISRVELDWWVARNQADWEDGRPTDSDVGSQARARLPGEEACRIKSLSWIQPLRFLLERFALHDEEILRALRFYLWRPDIGLMADIEDRSQPTMLRRLQSARQVLEDLTDSDADAPNHDDGETSDGAPVGGPQGRAMGPVASERKATVCAATRALARRFLVALDAADAIAARWNREKGKTVPRAGFGAPHRLSRQLPPGLRRKALSCTSAQPRDESKSDQAVHAAKAGDADQVARNQEGLRSQTSNGAGRASNPYGGMTPHDIERLAHEAAAELKASLNDPDLDDAIEIAWFICWHAAEDGADLAEPTAYLRTAAVRCFRRLKMHRSQPLSDQQAVRTCQEQGHSLPSIGVAKELDEAIDAIQASCPGFGTAAARKGRSHCSTVGSEPEFNEAPFGGKRTWLVTAAAMLAVGVLGIGTPWLLGGGGESGWRFVAPDQEVLAALTCRSEVGCYEAGEKGILGAASFDNNGRSDAVRQVSLGRWVLTDIGTIYAFVRKLLPADDGEVLLVAVAEGAVRVEARAATGSCGEAARDGGCARVINRGQFMLVVDGRNDGPRLVVLQPFGSGADIPSTAPAAAREALVEARKLLRIEPAPTSTDGGAARPAATRPALAASPVVPPVTSTMSRPSRERRVASATDDDVEAGGGYSDNNDIAGDGCSESVDCYEDGRCTASNGRCKAASHADCRKSQGCRIGGRCANVGGKCMATSDGDCGKSVACKNGGRCESVGGECRATSNEDCEKSFWCTKRGDCTVVDGRCRAASDADCAKAAACKVNGLCTATRGRCEVASDEDCSRSAMCQVLGHCSAKGGKCSSVSDEDCRKSEWCMDYGRCSAVGGSCVASSNEHCSRAGACKAEGRCTAVAGACKATSDEDCRRATACRESGDCVAVNGECKATSDEDCRGAAVCRERGGCTAVDGWCQSILDEDCRASQRCLTHGHCTTVDGWCRAASTAGCRKSTWCQLFGACTAVDGDCRATSDEDCRKSKLCETDGVCAAVDGECRATSDEDCRSSLRCKAEGRCTAVRGECKRPFDR